MYTVALAGDAMTHQQWTTSKQCWYCALGTTMIDEIEHYCQHWRRADAGRLRVDAVVRCDAISVHDYDSRCDLSRVVTSWWRCYGDGLVVVVRWRSRLHTHTHMLTNASSPSSNEMRRMYAANHTRNLKIADDQKVMKMANDLSQQDSE